ncbi:MAG TPA: hypothetical protein VFC09_09610 [Candidatus Dormibacteraeota bacterium]|nr:hypothetical protein [Candidatus Dormibacteraeota bacterium]
MAILRLVNGEDVTVKLSVADTVAAVSVMQGSDGFVELPTDDGPLHVRPAHIVAVLEEAGKKTAGFRAAGA